MNTQGKYGVIKEEKLPSNMYKCIEEIAVYCAKQLKETTEYINKTKDY